MGVCGTTNQNKKKPPSTAQRFFRIINKKGLILKEKVKACSIGSVSEKKEIFTYMQNFY